MPFRAYYNSAAGITLCLSKLNFNFAWLNTMQNFDLTFNNVDTIGPAGKGYREFGRERGGGGGGGEEGK